MIYVSSYYYICVLVLLYVSSYYYACVSRDADGAGEGEVRGGVVMYTSFTSLLALLGLCLT